MSPRLLDALSVIIQANLRYYAIDPIITPEPAIAVTATEVGI